MSVESAIPRIRTVVQNTLEARASEFDEVEWEVGLGLMQMASTVDDDVFVEVSPSANVYIRLSRLDDQECGVETKVYEPLPLDLCTNEFVAQWVDEAWDALVLKSMEVTLD